MFPSTHSMFNFDVSMMIFFAEIGWCENHDNSCRINKVAVEIMREEADDRASFCVPAGHAGGVRNVFFTKIGHITT